MQNADTRWTVSVIGLGEMGGALARALLAGGHRVTVWNRSPQKCEPYRQAGAQVADSPAAACEASEVVVVCVADYSVLRATLHPPETATRLAGKTVVQFSSRTPTEAREGGAWAARYGIHFLEGAVFAYPPAVGTPAASFVLSGQRQVFDAVLPLLACLGGDLIHAGDDIASSAALELSVVGTFVPGAVVAFLQGAALCEAEGASLDTYLALVERHAYPKLALAMMKLGVPMMKSGNYGYRGEGAPLGVWLAGLELACSATQAAGAKATFANAVTQQLRDAVEAGRAQDEMPAIYALLKKPLPR